jgi:predicted DNA-binding protein with PD1-like motif
MTYTFDGYNYLVRLERGERLAECFGQFFEKTRIDGGWVNGLGAAIEVTLGFYQLSAQEYQWRTFDTMMEIASLTGNLAKNNKSQMMFHVHGVFADRQYQTVGGHVQDLVAGATVELFIHRAYQPTYRKFDENVGLQVLDLDSTDD